MICVFFYVHFSKNFRILPLMSFFLAWTSYTNKNRFLVSNLAKQNISKGRMCSEVIFSTLSNFDILVIFILPSFSLIIQMYINNLSSNVAKKT